MHVLTTDFFRHLAKTPLKKTPPTQASRVVPKIRHPSTKKEISHPEQIAAAFGDFLKSSTHQKHQIRKVTWIIFLVT